MLCHVQEVRGHTLNKAPQLSVIVRGVQVRDFDDKGKGCDSKMSERLEVLRSNILNCHPGAFWLKALAVRHSAGHVENLENIH